MFGSSPKTYMVDKTVERHYEMPKYEQSKLHEYLTNVLQLEAVACKDWLTNKVDRSVTGKIARQQCQGELQLPLSDCGVVALDYRGEKGIATSLDMLRIPLAMYAVEHMWPTLSEELGVDVEYHKEGNLRLGKTAKRKKMIPALTKQSIVHWDWMCG